MKKIIAIALVMVMAAVVMTACSNETTATTPTQQPTQAATEAPAEMPTDMPTDMPAEATNVPAATGVPQQDQTIDPAA